MKIRRKHLIPALDGFRWTFIISMSFLIWNLNTKEELIATIYCAMATFCGITIAIDSHTWRRGWGKHIKRREDKNRASEDPDHQ